MMRQFIKILFVVLLVSSPVWATHTCGAGVGGGKCYIDFVGGNDSNSGATTALPWKHAPGMKGATGNASTQVPVAGDQYILKGGVTWDYTTQNLWSWSWTGSSGNQIYVGVDVTYFTGASWTRPIVNLGGGTVASNCTNSSSGGPVFKGLETQSGTGFVQFDNIEWTGMCSILASPNAGQIDYIDISRNCSSHIRISNMYMHGGAVAHDSSHNAHFIISSFGCSPADTSNQADHNYLDNTDICNVASNSCTLCAVEGSFNQFNDNFINGFSNGFVTDWSVDIYENTMQNIVLSPDNGVDHENGIENNGGTHVMMFNNVLQKFTNPGVVDFQLAPTNGVVNYAFNNVLPNMDGSSANPGNMQQCYEQLPAGNTCNWFNNTAEAGQDSGTPSGPCGRNTGPTTSLMTNQHCITTQTGTSWWAGSATFTTNLPQTKVAANAQGYTYNPNGPSFFPTSASGSTVGTGTNMTSTCNTINSLDTIAGAACIRDTTYGVAINAANHTITGPGRPATNPRPSSGAWDIGAYQFSGTSPAASAPTFSLPGGTYIGTQNLTMSTTSAGAVICYNTTGSPATNGTGCGAGSTLYTTVITVPIGITQYFAVAGGTGYTDSPVSTVSYTIHPVTLWSQILDYSRATDWTQAGIPGGIPARNTICQTVSLTAGVAAAASNATAIQTAVNACTGTNQVVSIPAGTWYSNGFFVSGNGGSVNSNVTLRGAGPDKTVLLIQSTVACFTQTDVCLGGNGNGYGRFNGSAPWTGDNGVAGSYNNWDTVINLGTWTTGANSPPVPGDLITLDQRDDSIGLCPASGGTGACTGNQGATESGTTVTLTTSIPHTYAIGNQVYVGGVSQPPPANGALGGQIFQSLIYPTNGTCTAGTVTINYGQQADFLASQTLTITAGAWASGVETLTVTSNPFVSHINGIRAITIAGTGTTLDGNTFVLNFAGNTSTTVAFNIAVAPATQPTTGTGTYNGDVIWISGSNGIFSGVHTIASVGTLLFTYPATCAGTFTAGNYILNPISYTGLWTITDIGCNVSGTYTSSASCGVNPINALRYTSPITGLISSGGGEVSVDTGGFYVSCVGGSNCGSQGGSGTPGAVERVCPFTNFGTGGTGVCATGEYSFRSQREVHQITAINGNSYTISPPISNSNWRTSQNPAAMFLGTGAYATSIGIEGVTIDGTNDQTGSKVVGLITLADCFQCWVRNVRTINGHRNHIWLPGPTAQSMVVDSYMFGSPGAAKSYGIETSGSSDLEQNNICQHVVTCIMNAGADSSVFAYIYAVDTGVSPVTDNIALISWNHDNAFYDLFEGSDINSGNFDSIHGNSDVNTVFRNRVIGQDTPKKTNYLVPVFNSSFNRVVNYVANILGTVGQQTNYQTPVNSSGTTTFIYSLPYWTSDGVLQDPITTSTVLRWGNYDTATAAVRWCATGHTGFGTTCASTSEIPTTGVPFIGGNLIPTQGDTGAALPPSFYLSSVPNFWQTTWGTPAFPAIGPDVSASGTLNTTCSGSPTACDGVGNFSFQIPAQLCFNNTTVDPAYQQTFTVTNATYTGTTVTLTIGANNFVVANTITVTGVVSTGAVAPNGFNGTFAVSSVTPTTISYTLSQNPGTYSSGGNVNFPNILLFSAPGCYPGAYPAQVSFVCVPNSIPTLSSNVTVLCTGTHTTWTNTTSFTVSGVTGTSLVTSTNLTPTSQSLSLNTSSGTGTLLISDTTDSLSTTISVGPSVAPGFVIFTRNYPNELKERLK